MTLATQNLVKLQVYDVHHYTSTKYFLNFNSYFYLVLNLVNLFVCEVLDFFGKLLKIKLYLLEDIGNSLWFVLWQIYWNNLA